MPDAMQGGFVILRFFGWSFAVTVVGGVGAIISPVEG